LDPIVPSGKIQLKFLFGLLTVLFGCSEPKSVPKDFELVVDFTASQPGNSGQTISLKTQDNKSYLLSTSSEGRATSKVISNQNVLLLYSEIVSARVFRLKNSYSDMNVLDGGTTSLWIKANGKEKTIRMRNTTPIVLESTFRVLERLIND
jgi:hypothetical protein